MSTKYFKKTTFWAREFRVPLFWSMDDNLSRVGRLFIYKNSVVHTYYLDDTEEKEEQIGYEFFTNKNNVKKYVQEMKETLEDIINFKKDYQKIKISRFTDREFKNSFFKVFNFLKKYGKTYVKTEEARLAKLDETKFKPLVKKLGGLRFNLRKEGEGVFHLLLGTFLTEIVKRFNLRARDLFFYTDKELINLFEGKKVKKNVLDARQRGYALISLKDRKILLTGEKFKKLYKEVVGKEKKAKEITGQVAMKGRAKGRVRLILHNKRNVSKEALKFKKGEILVTEMTRPDTVLACKKAAAIVTDEGGITSHASILSRELKIPCIIGTKIATQVLKDGNLVEVDAEAEKGVVKIYKRQ